MVMLAAGDVTTRLWTTVRDTLSSLPTTILDLPVPLAAAVSEDNRFHLRAQRLAIFTRQGTAEARLAEICGANVRIFNAVVIPERGDGTPLLLAEFMFTGGKTRVGFVDVQDLGLAPPVRACLKADLKALSPRRSAKPPPAWAIEFSLGAWSYLTQHDEADDEECVELQSSYLDCWLNAVQRDYGQARRRRGKDLAAHFKQVHLTHWPGKTFLERFFGVAWTQRFMCEFLYA